LKLHSPGSKIVANETTRTENVTLFWKRL